MQYYYLANRITAEPLPLLTNREHSLLTYMFKILEEVAIVLVVQVFVTLKPKPLTIKP